MSREAASCPGPISTIWVGPPASRDSGVVFGQDEFGVRQIAKTTAIKFWVLNEYIDTFKAKFADQPNITVRPIEAVVATTIKHARDVRIVAYATWIETAMASMLAPARNRVRDRVTIKEMVAFLLLHQLGGYVLDSNICPTTEGKSITFRTYDKLMLPAFKPAICSGLDMDVWMMYSPRHHARTLSSCLRFQSLCEHSEFIHSIEGYSRRFYSLAGSNITSATLDLAHSLALPNMKGVGTWEARHDRSTGIATIDDLGCEKYYFNTHKYTHLQNEALFLIDAGRIKHLQILLDAGEDINQTHTHKPWYNYSLVHAAIHSKRADVLAFLLSKKPDLTIAARCEGKSYTALQLCKALERHHPGEYKAMEQQISDHSSKTALLSESIATKPIRRGKPFDYESKADDSDEHKKAPTLKRLEYGH